MIKRTSRKTVFIATSNFLKPIKIGISTPPSNLPFSTNSKTVKYKVTDVREFIKIVLTVITSLGMEANLNEVNEVVSRIPEEDYQFWIKVINRVPRERMRQKLMKIGKAIREIYSI